MCDPVTAVLAGMSLIGNRQQKPPAVEDVVEPGGELEAARENTGAEVALGDDRDQDLLDLDPLNISGSSSSKSTAGTGLSTGNSGTGLSIL